jgi:hypothetical protein
VPISLRVLFQGENTLKLDQSQPRLLRYRNHFRGYFLTFLTLSSLLSIYWLMKFKSEGVIGVINLYRYELVASLLYCISTFVFYFIWIRSRLNRSVQVYPDLLRIQDGNFSKEIKYAEIVKVKVICWSLFSVHLQNGQKFFFNSSLDRVDYIWEGIHASRPDVISPKLFSEFRLKLIQYDHHQKRKDFFFKHKMVDLFNWIFMPILFLFFAHIIQTQQIIIHNPAVYFFRLFMYAILVLLSTSFFYSMIIKKLVFDKKVEQASSSDLKLRDLEFEGMILQRSKIFQVITAGFILSLVIKLDVNLFSLTKVREDISSFSLKKGSSVLIDNRYNCVGIGCKYQLHDGDFIVFGKGVIGQVLAKEGDFVGQVAEAKSGRLIASENVHEVPRGHLAIKAANGKDIIFVRIDELIGKIQN